MTHETSVSTQRLSPGEPAPDVQLRDHEDRLVPLPALWQAAPLVLFFERHLG